VTEVQDRNREVLAAVRIRRDHLYDAIIDLERALAMPASGRPESWAEAVAGRTTALRAILEAHIVGTEGDGGFFEDVRERAPQLLHAVKQLQEEHGPLLEATDALAASVATVTDDGGVRAVRDAAVELIRELLSHRHRGAELVYDAYSVDISAAD